MHGGRGESRETRAGWGRGGAGSVVGTRTGRRRREERVAEGVGGCCEGGGGGGGGGSEGPREGPSPVS